MMQIFKCKLTKDEFHFFFVWILFVSTLILSTGIFFARNEFLEYSFKYIRYFVYAICTIKLFIRKWRKSSLLHIILILGAFAVSGVGNRNLTYPLYGFIVLASIGIDSKKLVKITAIMQGGFLVTIVIFSQLGIILDYVFDTSTRSRHGLGFSWTTTAPLLFFYFCLSIIYLYREKLSYIIIVLFEIVNYWFYCKTDSKMAFSLLTVVLLFFCYEKSNKRRWSWLCRFNNLYILFPFFMLGFSILIVKVYNWYIPIWAKIDRLLSYRLGLAQNAYNTYGIHMLGQKIPWVSYDYKTLFETKEKYNFVDSSYLNISMTNGLIFMIVVLLLYSYAIWKAIRQNDYYLVMIFMFILTLCLTEPRLMNFAFNPFPLMALGDVSESFSCKVVSKKIIRRKLKWKCQ